MSKSDEYLRRKAQEASLAYRSRQLRRALPPDIDDLRQRIENLEQWRKVWAEELASVRTGGK